MADTATSHSPNPGPMEMQVRVHLTESFQPVHLEVTNESHMHSVPKGSETHFRIVVVSTKFEGLTRIARQRLVNHCLASELKGGIHALTQRCLTPLEWQAQGATGFQSPDCLGGSKVDSKT